MTVSSSAPGRSSPPFDVRVYQDLDALSQAAGARIVEQAQRAVAARGRFALVLAGGSTPQRLYELLSTTFVPQMPWAQTHLFWGDERFVPPTHPDSNFRLARAALIDRTTIPPDHVHRMPTTEHSDPEAAAAAYEQLLRHFFDDASPAFDVVLLGLGEDGHTASLFPDDEPWAEDASTPSTRWVEPVVGPVYRPPRQRLTLTLSALRAARRVFFLVSGEAKRSTLHAILNGAPESRRYPAAYVHPAEQLIWFVDVAAYGTDAA